MIPTQVPLEEEMARDAQKAAHRHGISFAELCRRALYRLLRRGSVIEPWMRYAGSVESGDPNASRSVDEVVYGRPKP